MQSPPLRTVPAPFQRTPPDATRAQVDPCGAPPSASELLGAAPLPTWLAATRGYQIPVRRYGTDGRGRPVIMLHGLESHAGWFVRSARHLAAHGFPVHAFDRCGSGVSRADATLGSDLEVLLAEIDTVGEAALAGTSHDRFTLVGHCFGALLALLYAGRHRPERVASLVLATPALHTRTDVPRRDKLRIVADVLRRGHARVPLPLEPEQFSELPAFVEMVRADPLALRSVPARLLFEVWRARFDLPKAAEALHAPLFVGMAQKDVICDNARNLRLLAHVTAPTAIVVYSGARHILELSAQSEAFLNDLATWLQRQEAS